MDLTQEQSVMPDSEPPRLQGVPHVEAGMASNSTTAGSSTSSSAAVVKAVMVKYGELVILGYNGQLPQGNCLVIIYIYFFLMGSHGLLRITEEKFRHFEMKKKQLGESSLDGGVFFLFL